MLACLFGWLGSFLGIYINVLLRLSQTSVEFSDSASAVYFLE